METYLAVDNVCAWPNIKRLRDGRLMVVHFNQPCHLRWEGTIDLRISEDHGRTWDFVSHPVQNEPKTNRGNVAVGVLPDGSILILCSGWDNVLPYPGKYAEDHYNDDTIRESLTGQSPLWPVRLLSTDSGSTWKNADIVIPENDPDFLWIPYGDILNLAGGRLGCSMYSIKRSALNPDYSGTDGKRGSFYFESSDSGLTWTCVGQISSVGNETALHQTSEGKLFAAVRSDKLDLFISCDQGRSWQFAHTLTGPREYPGSFTTLAEGFLMLSYGIRRQGLYGVGIQLLDLQDGTLKQAPLVLADFGPTSDGGYPSSLQLADGSIVTAYYAKSVPWHSRYHMGVKRWFLQEFGR